MSRGLRLLSLAAVVGGTLLVASTALANHAWNNYHWARSSNPFTVSFGNNLTGVWGSYLFTAASDWSVTSGACNNSQNPIRATVINGSSRTKNCRPGTGVVEVCNASYGNNGWLGLATIYVNGDHITKGSVKLNDYYFDQPQYNSSAWRHFVMDQETGHTFGLTHQDENFNNADLLDACGRGSCMDYSADPTNNQTPNQHDYDELVIIYSSHLDAGAIAASAIPADEGVDLEDPSAWGQAVRFADGRPVLFERTLGPQEKVYTWVVWTR